MGDNQQFEWHDSIAIQAWRNGGRLIINEIDHASPDATKHFCMQYLMTNLLQVLLSTTERKKLHTPCEA